MMFRLRIKKPWYVCPLLEKDGTPTPPGTHVTLQGVDLGHNHTETCCYYDAELVSETDQVAHLRLHADDGSSCVVEVLKDPEVAEYIIMKEAV
jgi:hypothetical protein